MKRIFTLNDAASFLASALPHKTRQQWWGYLKWNPQKWREQNGIRICCYVIDGEIAYTEASLKAFVGMFKQPKPQHHKHKEVA